jgi:hypothetical protein
MFTFNLFFMIVIREPVDISVVCGNADNTKGWAVTWQQDTRPPSYLAPVTNLDLH